MTEPVIRVAGLGKRYRLGEGLRHTALRNLLGDALRAPLRIFNGSNRASHNPPSAESLTASASAAEAAIAANGRKRFIWALKDVNFEVRQGEVLGLIGRNGAGKSTLLKILARITRPTEGHAEIHGRVGSLLEVGTGFHGELTGRENVYMSGAILGMRKAEIDRKFDEIVAFSEVERFLETPLKHYSSGMQMRLAFAVAAHLEPEILFVDEVLAVGDAAFQKKCLGKMGDVARHGRTVIFVSHNMAAVRSLSSRITWLADGRVIQTGPVNVVADNYLAQLEKHTSLETDFSKVERFGHYGTRLKINRVRMNRGEGIWHGKPLAVEFAFECLDDVEDVSFGVGFCNRDGGRIITFDSDLPGARWKMKRGQIGTAHLCVPELLLEPDFYTIDYGSRSGDNAALEYFPQCAQVTVLPSDATPAVIAMRESGRGGVRFPAKWNLVLEQAYELHDL
ncbi:MAG: ABC transporter ATP-binding protein [Candidatus Acidiferrales bacterium]